MRIAERLSVPRLRAAFDIPMHPGWHCHVFQTETFQDKFLKPLQFMGLIEFELVAYRGAKATTGGEFSLVLRKRKVDVQLATSEFFTKDYREPAAEGVVGIVRGVPSRCLQALGKLLSKAGDRLVRASRRGLRGKPAP